MRYSERLLPGPGTLVAALLVGPAVYVVVLPLRVSPLLPGVAAVAVAALVEAVLLLSAPRLLVGGGELQAGPARIGVALTGAAEAFRGTDARTARGVELDARAWTLLRGWIDPVLRVRLEDPDDPAPYWVLSTRRPEALRAALDAERAALLDAAGDDGSPAAGPPGS